MVAVGIDLGTTNSCVAVYDGKDIKIVQNYDDLRMLKSTVFITDDEIRAGKNATFENSQNMIYNAKQMIGRKCSDYSDISSLNFPFEVKQNSRDCPVFYIPNLTKRRKYYSPEEIISFILRGLRAIVEDLHFQHGKKLETAVFTVPAYFNDSQREAIKVTAEMAGMKVLKFLSEPAAAVLAFCYQIEITTKEQNIIVYNLGGSTFDVSLIKLFNGKIEVKAVNKDINLGGNNFDERLVEYLTKKCKEKINVDIKNNKKALWRMKVEAIKAKEHLSSNDRYKLLLDSLQNDEDFKYEIKRSEFEFICQDLFIRTLQLVNKTMKDAALSLLDINQVLLVGGSTRIPKIQELLADKFGSAKINKNIAPDEAIALGAAIQAAIINGEIKVIIGEIEKEKEIMTSFVKRCYTFPDKIKSNDVNINVIGIDLGTSRCCAAVNRKNGIETVALDNSDRLLPSYVAYDEENVKCGRIVIQRLRNHFKASVFDSKRIIGRRFDEIVIDAFWPFRVIDNQKKVFIETQSQINKKLINAEEVAAALLKHTKELAEKFQGKEFNQVVITVPAAFTKSQQEATLKASKLAGLNAVEILPEPIAAAFAYFAEREIPNNCTLFLFDLGGGTLDVCIFKIQNNQIHIISNTGDTKLGGRDFDNLLINYFDNILKTKYNITVPAEKKYKLMQHCEKIKENLSFFENDIGLDVDEMDPSKEGIIYISREEFQTMAKELLEKIKNTIFSALFNSGLQKGEINKILQVGGGSRMPMIKKLLHDIFPNAEHCCEQNPDEVVAVGAAYYAYYLKSKPQAIKKVTPVSEKVSSKVKSGKRSLFSFIN